MLMAQGAVEIPVLRRQGKSIREIGADARACPRKTIRCYLRRDGLPRYTREAQPSKAQPLQALLR